MGALFLKPHVAGSKPQTMMDAMNPSDARTPSRLITLAISVVSEVPAAGAAEIRRFRPEHPREFLNPPLLMLRPEQTISSARVSRPTD